MGAKSLYNKFSGRAARMGSVNGVVCGYLKGSTDTLIMKSNNNVGWPHVGNDNVIIGEYLPTDRFWYIKPYDIIEMPVRRYWTRDEVKMLFTRYNEYIAHNDVDKWENWIDNNLK